MADYRGFEDGDLVRVEGTTQVYQGGLQLIATSICKARPMKSTWPISCRSAPAEIDRLAVRLAELLRGDERLAAAKSGRVLFDRREFMERLARSPAGIKNHHAYPGGLLEHVVNLMEVAEQRRRALSDLTAILLLMGVFLHDMGKVEELSSERGFAYTDDGQLLGHVVLAISMLDKKLRRPRNFPANICPRRPCCD